MRATGVGVSREGAVTTVVSWVGGAGICSVSCRKRLRWRGEEDDDGQRGDSIEA